MRFLLLLVLLSFGLISRADDVAPAADETPDRKILNDLVRQADALDKSCQADGDCLNTGFTEVHCASFCGYCGQIINRQQLAAFEKLRQQAGVLGEKGCVMGRCVPRTCEVKCLDHVCVGTAHLKTNPVKKPK